jgi:hypothetical protein
VKIVKKLSCAGSNTNCTCSFFSFLLMLCRRYLLIHAFGASSRSSSKWEANEDHDQVRNPEKPDLIPCTVPVSVSDTAPGNALFLPGPAYNKNLFRMIVKKFTCEFTSERSLVPPHSRIGASSRSSSKRKANNEDPDQVRNPEKPDLQ